MIFKIAKAIYDERKKEKLYCQMSAEELEKLPGEDFLEALSARILQEEGDMEVAESVSYFQGAKRIFYIIDYFNMEIENGGLCQFFVNSSKVVAPYILDSLGEIGASSYMELLEKFVRDNRISLNDLSSFEIEETDEFEDDESEDEYEMLLERYPFEEFDEAYCELYEEEPLSMLLEKYCKEHIEEFA